MLPCSVRQIEETGRQRQANILAEAERARRSLDAIRSLRAPRPAPAPAAKAWSWGTGHLRADAAAFCRILARPARAVRF
jgi:hypothetical protein